ncbi:guanine nucleotide exchange factor subunit Rich isoform X1 [Frankliniella occidentalis]|uniref:Protein RIC1 homolog n=1 Tax=Frankliniella occidentalis TaxID=133901 RepID=A0A6J1T8B2_FRAOC|nr:guanine nucleotide exchange factor subunit Rich isoform X1 [Frankliniella occidentalis]
MYFPIGWPRVLSFPQHGQCSIRQVICNRDKILFAILTDDTLSIWFCKPCLPIVSHRRPRESVQAVGSNESVEWRPDSSMLVVITSAGYMLMYRLGVRPDQKGLYEQVDSPTPSMRRDSAELFLQESIPPLLLTLEQEISVFDGSLTCLACIRDELMIATTQGHILRYRWDGHQNRDYNLDLRRIPFSIDQQVSKAIPIVESNTYVISIDYSPLVGGFAVVLNDGRAAFLTASTLKFDPNVTPKEEDCNSSSFEKWMQVQGIWAQNVDDATCAAVNHKYRLIAFGRKNSQATVYCVDETTGGLEVTHQIVLSPKDYPGCPGRVRCIRWTPDGRCVALAWANGGLSLWSTFGALLLCSLGWDYGLNSESASASLLNIQSMEWSAEGYQLWMVRRLPDRDLGEDDGLDQPTDAVVLLDFVKSALTVNPCMGHLTHLYLQGEDKLFINLGGTGLSSPKKSADETKGHGALFVPGPGLAFAEPTKSTTSGVGTNSQLMGSKQWVVVPLPSTYSAANWPIRYTAMDLSGEHLAVAGRAGLALYSVANRKWKLFGSESQERDIIVSGGLLWWGSYVVLAAYSVASDCDQLRLYPRDSRLDNSFATVTRLPAQALLLNILQDRLVTFCSDARVTIYALALKDNISSGPSVEVTALQMIDISALCVHPACVVSLALTPLRTESGRSHSQQNSQQMESIVMNVSGRLLMVQREHGGRVDPQIPHSSELFQCTPPTVLASCVEHVWVPNRSVPEKPHLTEALWLFCGAHGMRVWLPLFPRSKDNQHSFMAKRIMLPFHLRIYPLAILFEDAILLGAENDTLLYTSDTKSPFSLPFCVLERTSQVYLHQILRQLIRRNLGYHAWEIARSCTALPYFPHSLELLLHEVLEEEATSKQPIPDALLPSVVEFIQEFPVYLETVAHCARKTEIALWPYLFSAAGKPKDLFQECLARWQLDTAASYLIILQNLEPSTVSRQYATLLLDAALENCHWELSKDLVRFLRAIDPNDVESPRASFVMPSHSLRYGLSPQSPPLSPSQEDLTLVLGTMQVSRGRSFSTTLTPKLDAGGKDYPSGSSNLLPLRRDSILKGNTGIGSPSPTPGVAVPLRRKKSVPTGRGDSRDLSGSAEEFFMDVILQRHARRLLSTRRLADLGRFAARLDFHLVAWLARERERAARVDEPVAALQQLHADFHWPHPAVMSPLALGLDPKKSSILTEEHLQTLSIDVTSVPPGLTGNIGSGSRIGDSGYMSQSGVPNRLLPHNYTDYLSSPNCVEEARLVPHTVADDRSIVSEESSYWGDEKERDRGQYSPDDVSGTWSQAAADMTSTLEQLTMEGSIRGSQKVEVQLRYLLQLMTEAGCLEWALILAILLHDALAVVRTTAAARAPSQSYSCVLRLRDTITTLTSWSNTECIGYKPFMMAIQGQVGVLTKLMTNKQQHQMQQYQLHQQLHQQQVTPQGVQNPTTNAAFCIENGNNQEYITTESLPMKADRTIVTPSSSRPRSDTASSSSTVMTAGPLPSTVTSQESGIDTVQEGIDVGKVEEENPMPLEAKPEAESGCTIS